MGVNRDKTNTGQEIFHKWCHLVRKEEGETKGQKKTGNSEDGVQQSIKLLPCKKQGGVQKSENNRHLVHGDYSKIIPKSFYLFFSFSFFWS